MGDACRAFGTPVTGGNVSFYNEHPEGAVFPTPTIGMLGIVEDVERDTTTIGFKDAGDRIFLMAPSNRPHATSLGGSEYLFAIHGMTAGEAPRLDLDEERAVHEAMLALIRSGRVKSAHDASDGGLAVCLAEKILETEGLGADVTLPAVGDRRLDVVLFGEDHSRIVFTVAEADADDIERTFVHPDVQIIRLGEVTGESALRVGTEVGELAVVSAADMKRAYFDSIENAMQHV